MRGCVSFEAFPLRIHSRYCFIPPRFQLLLMAPLCANTLASVALGMCNNLLTSVARAWYFDLEPAFALPLAIRSLPESSKSHVASCKEQVMR